MRSQRENARRVRDYTSFMGKRFLFKKRMGHYFGETRINCYTRFEFITSMNDWQKRTFQNVMEMTILNLDIRFPCPSLSIQTTVAKEIIDPATNTLDPAFTKRILMKCPFIVEVELFLIPDRFIKERQINPWFLRKRTP